MSDLVQTLVDGYTDLIKNGRRNHIKSFNKNIEEYKYFLVYPFLVNDEVELMVGFSNESTVYQMCEDDMHKAFKLIESCRDYVKCDTLDVSGLTETLVIDASRFARIHLEVPNWRQLIDAPEIMKSDFSVLTDSFCKFFGLQEEQYDRNYDLIMDFKSWFGYNENQPVDLDLKVVWNDVDSYDNKFGTRTINVFWKGEFIGFISGSFGRWEFVGTEYTVNYDKWTEMMDAIYSSTGFVKDQGAGVIVLEMHNTSVEDYTSIPGVSDKDYGNE
jgi:hypothetical protein